MSLEFAKNSELAYHLSQKREPDRKKKEEILNILYKNTDVKKTFFACAL